MAIYHMIHGQYFNWLISKIFDRDDIINVGDNTILNDIINLITKEYKTKQNYYDSITENIYNNSSIDKNFCTLPYFDQLISLYIVSKNLIETYKIQQNCDLFNTINTYLSNDLFVKKIINDEKYKLLTSKKSKTYTMFNYYNTLLLTGTVCIVSTGVYFFQKSNK